MTAELAVVCDMCLRHQEIVAADAGYTAAASRSPMDRYKFPDLVSLAYLDRRGLAGILEVLRRKSDRHERKNVSFASNSSIAIDNDVRIESNPIAEDDAIANDTKWSDHAIGPDSRTRTNNCGLMDRHLS
jgi:hypothetical protein